MTTSRALRALTVLLFLLVAGAASVQAQFTFLPSGTHFAPLRANLQEARIGIDKFLDRGEMKVDVGNAIDLFAYRSGELRVSAGIDFFAYAYTTGAQGLRLQIDAIDGFFGGDLAASVGDSARRDEARLRLLHQSAHLVDGHYVNGAWIDGRTPVPYTRDFGELVVAHVERSSNGTLRPYAGFSYATLVRPASIRRLTYLAGIEGATGALTGCVLGRPTSLFAAYEAYLSGIDAYATTHRLQAGVKFGEWEGKGPAIYLSWHHGTHPFAEYYDRTFSAVGAGFTVDF